MDVMPSNNTRGKKTLYRLWLVTCVLAYILLNGMIIFMDPKKQIEVFGSINRSVLNGIVSQGQVLAIILITLNPVRKSHQVAWILCSLTALISLQNILSTKTLDALPGVFVPITSALMSFILFRYSEKQKHQIQRISESSQALLKNEEQLNALAYYDTLTGLPNRHMFISTLESIIASNTASTQDFVLVLLDIDNFKNINDTMGHSVGDAILKQITERWSPLCHPDDMLARVGGDEFMIMIRHTSSPDPLSDYLAQFSEALSLPFTHGSKVIHAYTSLGIAKYPEDGTNIEQLFQSTDIALYKAKNEGKNCLKFFHKTMAEDVTRKIRLEEGLQSAIRNNELQLVYQPQYDSQNYRIFGVEALLRWNHPDFGPISPVEFIPIAETTGAIIPIGYWVLETAIQMFISLKKQFTIDAHLSVNISVRQLLDPSFVATVQSLLDKTGFDSRFLVLEITESVFISNPEEVTRCITALRDLGLSIALDDFGTGYASLNYLQMLPISILKIDKLFTEKIQGPHLENHMVGAIISLAHKLGMSVIAEGVETEEQSRYLAAQRCDYLQGYLLSKPLGEKVLSLLYAEQNQ